MAALAQARRGLAHAEAYIVLNRRTWIVELMGGPQVDYLLTDIYGDRMVKQLPGGEFAVSRPYPVAVGEAHEVLQYVPLHRDQQLFRHISPDALYRPYLSLEGRTFREMPVMNGKALLKYTTSHEGSFHRTLDGAILRTHRATRNGPPRILGKWKQLSAADFAATA